MLYFKIKLLRIILLAVLSIVSLKCQKKSSNDETSNETVQSIMTLIGKPDQEKVALLSIKYNLEVEITETILDEYLTINDFEYSRVKTMTSSKPDTTSSENPILFMTRSEHKFKESILSISTKYNIRSWTVANLIIDYLIWIECENLE